MNLFKANSEYMATPKHHNPYLVQNPETGLYHVTVFFSEKEILRRNFIIIK